MPQAEKTLKNHESSEERKGSSSTAMTYRRHQKAPLCDQEAPCPAHPFGRWWCKWCKYRGPQKQTRGCHLEDQRTSEDRHMASFGPKHPRWPLFPHFIGKLCAPWHLEKLYIEVQGDILHQGHEYGSCLKLCVRQFGSQRNTYKCPLPK